MAVDIAIGVQPGHLDPGDITTAGLRYHYLARDRDAQKLKPRRKETYYKDEVLDDIPGPIRPFIPFMADWVVFKDRESRLRRYRKDRSLSSKAFPPPNFPPRITGPRLWTTGITSGDLHKFIVHLSDYDLGEIDSALKYFKGHTSHNQPNSLTKNSFPLPSLGRKLARASERVHTGAGLVLLRGIDPRRYSDLDNVLLYVGISSYIGEQRGCQDRTGAMLTHIVSRGKPDVTSPGYTTSGLPWHTDVCDVLALYAKEQALSGGELYLASSAAVYNDIMTHRPDVMALLTSRIWHYDMDNPTTPKAWPTRRIIYLSAHHGPVIFFSRRKLVGSADLPLSPSVPPMTEAQAEALDVLHFTAERHRVTIRMAPGDILFANNLAVLHARASYTESFTHPPLHGDGVIETGRCQRRHLMRLWLRNRELKWHVPELEEGDLYEVYDDASERRERAWWPMRAEDVDLRTLLRLKYTCPT